MPIVVVAGSIFADEAYDGPDWSGVLVPPGSPLKSWADFEGKKIGIPDLGGLPQLLSTTALEANGVDPDSVEFVALPLPALAEAAAKGDVDATYLFSVFYTTAKEDGFTPIPGGVHKYLPNTPQNLWIASRSYVEENPEAIERFRAGLAKGTEFSNANVDVARQIYHDHTELPADFIDNSMIVPAASIELNREGWELLLKVMADAGDIPDTLTYEDIVWDGARS
jgi:NitT/TauT family transport system substrate-binding protein